MGIFWACCLLSIVLTGCDRGMTEQKFFQWQVIEFKFTASRSTYGEPWKDVKMTMEFTGPGGEAITIPGFWDGGRTWKVRFAPPSPGEWLYVTASNDSGLAGHEGAITVEPANSDNPLYMHGGFLKVSENGRYLTYSDGEPFFWLGDIWWYAPSKYMPLVGSSNPEIISAFKHAVEVRKNQGYTVLVFGFLGGLAGYDGPVDFHRTRRIEPKYWQEVDKYIEYAVSQGFIPVASMIWHDPGNTLEDWKTLWEYFLARYAAYPVTWQIQAEYNAEGSIKAGITQISLAIGEFLDENDPYDRASSIHAHWYKLDGREHWDAAWLDFLMLEGAHEDPYGVPDSVYEEAYTYNPTRPMVLTETSFEGIQRHGYPPHSDSVVRRNFYRAMQQGCTGVIYGAHGLWYPTQREDDQTFWKDWGKSVPWWEALELPGGYQMGYLKRFYESIEWWKLQPKSFLLTYEPVVTNPRLAGVIGILALGEEDDATVAVYFPAGNGPDSMVTYKTSQDDGTMYDAQWFDPRTGEFGGNKEFLEVREGVVVLPDRPSADDWVLVLRRRSA